MKIEPAISEAAIVLIGEFSPNVFQPSWFAYNGIISADQADAADIKVIYPDVCDYTAMWLRVLAQRDRFQVSSTEPPYVRLKDLIVKTFTEFLPGNPLVSVGMNYSVHFDVGSYDKRDLIGNMLAPKEPWGEWGSELKKEERDKNSKKINRKGGMLNITMVQNIFEHDRQGMIKATVQPSNRIKKNEGGIFMHVNDHFDVKDKENTFDGKEIMDIVANQFEGSIKNSKRIIDQIMGLANQCG